MAKFNELWWHLSHIHKGIVIAGFPIVIVLAILSQRNVYETSLFVGFIYGILCLNWWVIPDNQREE